MDVKWTSEQKKVIDLRDRDILVSAAAGSGKTAVLVERIVNRICVDNPPVDIDRMLVVTFTKAAAAEMRERVSRACIIFTLNWNKYCVSCTKRVNSEHT